MHDLDHQHQTRIAHEFYFWLNRGLKQLCTSQPISQAGLRQHSDDDIGEDMRSWDGICEAVNVTYEHTKPIDETAKIVSARCWELLDALGFSDS